MIPRKLVVRLHVGGLQRTPARVEKREKPLLGLLYVHLRLGRILLQKPMLLHIRAKLLDTPVSERKRFEVASVAERAWHDVTDPTTPGVLPRDAG
jgi:hypothetical protein